MNINIVCEAIGTALDAPTACYTTTDPESLVGVEITDLGGQLAGPHVSVFITCGAEGRKAFLTAHEARELSDILTSFADRLDAGAISAQTS